MKAKTKKPVTRHGGRISPEQLIEKRIQVLWELPGGSQVWWDAEASNLQIPSDKGIEGATATLLYGAGHGYRSSSALIKFTSKHYLQHVDESSQSPMSWRACQRTGKRMAPLNDKEGSNVEICGDGRLRNEMNLLRRRVTETSDNLYTLQRRVELVSPVQGILHESQNYNEARVKSVMAFLRQRLALQLQRSPRNKTGRQCTDTIQEVPRDDREGITWTCIRASADCELHVFELIARIVRNEMHGNPEAAQFLPSYELTQIPSEGTRYFRILFPSFSGLCKSIGITSVADRLEMMQKYGMCRGEGVMRLLGTYSFDVADVDKPAQISIGTSCGLSLGKDNTSRGHTEKTHNVLVRETRAWNIDDRRYENRCGLKSA